MLQKDPLIVAARTLAMLWYWEQEPAASPAEAQAWAADNFVGFLADASAPIGRALEGAAGDRPQAAAELADLVAGYGEAARQDFR